MIDIGPLEQYFPALNKPIGIGRYILRVVLQQTDSTFILNLKIKQKSVPGEHIIKFRFGLGQDEPREDSSHELDRPHFEIETYSRGDETISTTVYFTFQNASDKNLISYAKGTVVMIERIMQSFLVKNKLHEGLIDKIIYSEAVLKDLEGFDSILIDALAKSFETGNLILREGYQVIKTPYKLKKSLSAPELEPLLLPLLERIRKR